MAYLQKHETVMTLHNEQRHEAFVYFETKPDEGERTDGYYMTLERWGDFGCPNTITVSAELGDTLNG